MHLLVTSDNYPTPSAPNFGTFVSALVEALGRPGIELDVVAPVARFSRHPFHLRLRPPAPLPSGAAVRVKHPLYTSLSTFRLGAWSGREQGISSFVGSVRREAARSSRRPQLAYGHFLYRGGAAALAVGEDLGIPAVVALGEATFDDYERDLGIERVRRDLGRFQGIIAVSGWIRDRCVERYGVDPTRIRVHPNGTDTDRFEPRGRRAARDSLGLPADRPIIVFVGHFIERKGPLRVLEALRSLPDAGAVFIGEGPQRPGGPQVLYADRARHEDIPLWLAAADLFVLPTLAEGSCNAVVEAMACGRAIVSSDIPSIRELTGEDAAQLVDPADVGAISRAIGGLLADDAARERLEAHASERAERFSLAARADAILEFLDQIVSDG